MPLKVASECETAPFQCAPQSVTMTITWIALYAHQSRRAVSEVG